jgi:hypothetical protein
MPYHSTVYNLFIASPSDVQEERTIARDVIYDWNAINESLGIILQPLGWETHCFPDMSDRAQGVINRQTLEKSDLLIAIFKCRIGTATGVAEGGTIEEIENHLAKSRPAMIYFSSEDVPRNADTAQLAALRKAEENYRKRGLVHTFKGPQSFRDDFRRHLGLRMVELLATSRSLTERSPQVAIGSDPAFQIDERNDQLQRQKFSNLQEVFLEIDLTVAPSVKPWRQDRKRKIMRMPRSFIESEGFVWDFPGLVGGTPFRQLVMSKARRLEDADFNWNCENCDPLPITRFR